ncbi:unnamed protein product [Adineta ricciae]|uniref:TTF-type domain-containing protein n=2 Tax=Adineta ricciae TaxID=249248 RepID=A0A815B203_ADIRI|nr:unnamed protein product [Adineta ricciae]
MNSEKRQAIDSYFISSNKKSRTDEQQTDSTMVIPSSLSIPEFQQPTTATAVSCSKDQTTSDSISDTSSSSLANSVGLNESFEATSIPNDISKSSFDPPAQPKLGTYPVNQQKRSFQSAWYTDRQWLEYSVENNSCFCYYCRHFSWNKLAVRDAFSTSGFNNWKKALDNRAGLIKHASSSSHLTATKNYLSYKQREETCSNIVQKLDSGRTIRIRKNRDRLTKICSTLLVLSRQMIGLRGHVENERSSNRGNFLEILHWAAKTDPIVQSIFEDSTSNATYLSHDIQNELIHIMGNQIREKVSSMVNGCMYALMADECRDISGHQQLSIVIRFVRDLNDRMASSTDVVKEYFLGFVPLEAFDAATLAQNIVEFLKQLNIPLQSCICLCFDGASVTSGCHAGVHVHLRKFMPKAVYVHCSAHRLNLVISDTCKAVYYMLDYFSIVVNIYSFFTESGVTNAYFKKAQKELGLIQSSTLKLWAWTRWDSRWQAIDSMIDNFPAILRALDDVSEESSGARSINAGGLLVHVKRSIFIITSFILHRLFGLIKVLSDHLKSSSVDYVRGEHLIKSIIKQIEDLRNEQSFGEIYAKAKDFCDANNVDLLQQYRSRRVTAVPARFEAFVIDSTLGQREVLSSSTDFMNRIYFPLIDCMLVELNDRFSSQTLSLMKSISTVYPESGNFLDTNDINEFSQHTDADANALRNEFLVIKPMLQSKSITDVISFLNELIPLSGAFPQTLRMIKNAITMPISQVTCERSFSKMKIIKNYLRNSMTDQRLSDLAVLTVERDFEIDFERVIDKFSINHKNSRILLH